MNASRGQGSTGAEAPRGRYYTLDPAKILPGDVLLNTSPTALVSRAIRWATWSRYSHAAMCSENNYFVEAINLGVRRFVVQTLAARDQANLRVLRLRRTIPDAESIARNAGRVAEGYVSRHYWKAGAFSARSRHISFARSGSFFCSHLVAQAYRDAGFDLVEGREPEKVAAADLLKSPHLEDVTDQVLVDEGAVRYLEQDFVEGGQRATAHNVEVVIKQQISRRAVGAFRERGLPVPGDFKEVLMGLVKAWNAGDATDLDAELGRIMKEEGLFSILDTYFPGSSSTFSQAEMVAVGIEWKLWNRAATEQLVANIRRDHALVTSRLEGIRLEVETFQRIAKATGSELFGELFALHDALAEMNQRIGEIQATSLEMLETSLREMSE